MSSVYVCFEVDDVVFAVPRDAVEEVLPLPLLSRPPGAPAAVGGLFDVGGELLIAVHLDRVLGLAAAEPGLYAHMIRLAGDDASIALVVDRVRRVVEVTPADVRPVEAEETFRGCVVGEFHADDGQLIHVLSSERVLNERERQRLADYRKLEESRRAAFEESPA
jgi:purine-binding chemotaxis protein CheW